MPNRRRALISILIVAAGVSMMPAETILLFVDTLEAAGFTGESLPLAAAVEDAIMESFFDEGHIIFNAGLREAEVETGKDISSDGPEGLRDRFPVFLAKSGGAGYLLEVYLSYVKADERIVSADADYSFFSVTDGTLIAKGRVEGTRIEQRNHMAADDLCLLVGRNLAADVKFRWRYAVGNTNSIW